MTDDPAAAAPPRVAVTDRWLAENRGKRLAYEEQRRRHAQAWHKPGESEPEPDDAAEPAAAGRGRKSSRGPIHDKRQGSLDI